MNVHDSFARLINMPSPTMLSAALGLGSLIAVLGLLLLIGTRRWVGRIVAPVGLILIMLVLVVVREQTITERQTEIISSTRPRFSERARFAAGLGLFAVPSIGGLLTAIGYLTYRRRSRAKVPRHIKAGLKHLYQKEYEAALLEYNQAIHIAPDLAEGYSRRAAVYQAMGHPSLALADLDRALMHDPRLASALLERGKIRTETGDLDHAIIDFGHLLKIRSNDPDFFLSRGICFLKKGLLEDAASDFQRVLKLTNHSDFAEPAKAYLQQCESQGRLPSAVPTPNAAAPGAYSS